MTLIRRPADGSRSGTRPPGSAGPTVSLVILVSVALFVPERHAWSDEADQSGPDVHGPQIATVAARSNFSGPTGICTGLL